jgi:hypothetical protein
MNEQEFINEEEQTQNQTQNKPKTGAKIGRAISVIAICAILGGGAVYHGLDLYKDYQETKRAESIVANYIDSDYLVTVPNSFLIDQAYDKEFCEGEKLIDELKNANAQYCIIDGVYYTNDGGKIAILTYEITKKEEVEPIAEEYNGTTIYMAPAGYTLEDGVCTKEITGTVSKIVPATTNGDYSHISIKNVAGFKLVNVEEIQTLSYEEIYGTTLVCDVDDNAKLSENGYCEATFKLVPRK